MVNEPSFNVRFAFRCKAHIFTYFFRKLQNLIKSSEQWYACPTTLPEWLADMTDLVNIANACTHWRSSIGRGKPIVWVHVMGVSMDRIIDKWGMAVIEHLWALAEGGRKPCSCCL